MNNSIGVAVSRLASEADVVGRLAEDGGAFAALVAAFESRDPGAFRWVLERLEMLPYCELICEWVRIKLCTLRCSVVCTPEVENPPVPSFEAFARSIVRLAENKEGLRRVVDAVACGNPADYANAIEGVGLREYCRLICFWVCSVGYQRICEIICRREPVMATDAVAEIRSAGNVVAQALANERAFAAISKAAIEGNCEILRSAVTEAGLGQGCHILCRLICVWRCVRVCRELCVIPEPVVEGSAAIEEARNFALAFRKLAAQPRVLNDLVAAVEDGNAERYSQIVSRYALGPYCRQICSWVCGVFCSEFCYCVCPPPVLDPWFTTVGDFNIYSDIDPNTGLTNKSLPPTPSLVFGGGPNFAFFEQLQLGGWCPATSPISPGTPMQYRFLYATESTSLAAAIDAVQTTIHVTGGAVLPPTPFTISVCNAGETGETMTVSAVAANTWTVTRGQGGTVAEAAALGATLWVNPQPITGGLVAPWQVDTRITPWPINVLGLAGATNVSTFQTVYVFSPPFAPPPELPPPSPGTPWYPPSIHFIEADPTSGWIAVDQNAVGGGFQILLGFDTTQAGVAPGGDPLSTGLAIGTPGGAPAGTAVPAASLRVGVDLTIIFQATRVGAAVIDFSNSLCKIHLNNWSEVNNLWFHEFTVGSGCCQPINDTLTVEFTVDHETLVAGDWRLRIDSCSPSAPGDITPPNPTAGVTFTPGGRGASGSLLKNTTTWTNCSYTGKLFTRPGLTTGLADRTEIENDLTFCICGH